MVNDLIEKFYTALAELNANGMAACYHQDVEFEDPAFGKLKGDRARNMWRMLCANAEPSSFKLNFSKIQCQETNCRARVEAHYIFSKTGRKVHNRIRSEFVISDGLIVRHVDHFNLYNWSRQALGLTGYLLGWSSFFRKKLNAQTNRMLDKFEATL